MISQPGPVNYSPDTALAGRLAGQTESDQAAAAAVSVVVAGRGLVAIQDLTCHRPPSPAAMPAAATHPAAPVHPGSGSEHHLHSEMPAHSGTQSFHPVNI